MDQSTIARCQFSDTPVCQPMLQIWISASDKELQMQATADILASFTEEPQRYLGDRYRVKFSATERS